MCHIYKQRIPNRTIDLSPIKDRQLQSDISKWRVTMARNTRLVFLGFTLIALIGCVGKKNILFVTKTSLGVDIDSAAPAFDVGYDRKEGSVAPVVKDGQVLPLMSSISAEEGIASSVFGSGVAQNFGVGNAAIIMSRYLGSTVNPADSSTVNFEDLLKTPANVKGNIESGKRYFFGTKTTIGFSTGFTAGWVPESISLGYKRKELALVPIREQGKGETATLSIPSLIAASGTSASAGTNQAEFAVSQFYATGKAANYLAAHPTVRNSVISAIMGDDELNSDLLKNFNEAIADQKISRGISKEVHKRASSLFDSMPDIATLDKALISLRTAGIAEATDVFEDYNNDGSIDIAEKRTKLKGITDPWGNEDIAKLVSKWVDDNTN